MAVSINGWPVLSPSSSRLGTFVIPGTVRKITLRKDIAPLLLALAAEYDKAIASIDGGTFDDWGYAYRPARLANKWSDHSSGTAEDFNAVKEGRMGTGPYAWWKKNGRYLKAKALKAKYKYVIWGGAASLGGDYRYSRNWDWMHWAIKPGASLYDIQLHINKLGIKPNGYLWGTRPTVRVSNIVPGKRHAQVVTLKKALAKQYPDIKMAMNSDLYGTAAQNAYKRWERDNGYSTPNSRPDLRGLTLLGNKFGFRALT